MTLDVTRVARKAMSLLGTLMTGLIASNGLIFVSLLFFRRSRPELQAELFRWVVRTNEETTPRDFSRFIVGQD
jgi:hypothetical protein